jgi:radical SAM protein with 4Fe4S-binding SPASM domain
MTIEGQAEPMVRKDFWDIAERLGDGGLRVALSTNGTLITRESAERLARLGISYVGISLDSPMPAIHNMFRGSSDAFKRAMDGIRNSIEAGLDVGLRMTITKLNILEAPYLVSLARDIGVKRIAYYLLDLTGRGRSAANIMPTGDQLRSFLDRLIELSTEYNGDPEIVLVRGNFMGIYVADKISRSREEFLSLLNMISSQGDCGRKAISIYPDGKVKPCQFIDRIDIGDLRIHTLKEILTHGNPTLKTFLEIYRHLRGPRCSKCPFKQICGGGSRGRALVLTGDFWGDDPACIIDPDKLSARWKLGATS